MTSTIFPTLNLVRRGWFQDPDHVHFLMEPSLGGEVCTLLEEKGYLEIEQVRFIAANLVLGFEYLHEV